MLRITHKNKKYSAELKKQAVQSYLNWPYPAFHYVREANGSIRVVYSPIGS